MPFFLIKTPKKKSILYLAAFFPNNAGYHWRVKKWAEILEENGYNVTILNAINEHDLKRYESNPSLFMFRFLNKRFWQVLKARRFETVIVRRELLIYNDYGNLFLEKLLRKLCNHLILDFDDDLAAAKNQPKEINALYAKLMLENGNSFRESFKYYDRFMVASNYLKEYVLSYINIDEKKIEVIPTCVDYDKYPSKIYDFEDGHTISLGWIGGDHNYYLLQNIIPILNELAKKYTFKLIVIGGSPFKSNANFEVDFKAWSLKTEISDLLSIDIGLMPLDNSEESKGKGGFKLIQYMGLGIVSIAQNVTINSEIIKNNVDSFLYIYDNELFEIIERCIKETHNFENISILAKRKIENNYSFKANTNKYIQLICVE